MQWQELSVLQAQKRQRLSTRDNPLTPKGRRWAMSETLSVVTTREDVTGVCWVEPRDSAKHPTTTAQPLTAQNDPTPNANCAEVEKREAEVAGAH